MREIVSPLSGIRSPFGPVTSLLAMYAVLGFKPQLAFDFDDERYFTGSRKSTFSDAITHSASSNATMVDSDGLLKWRPHNLLTYSEQFDNAAWVKTNTTVTANAAVSLDGSLTADLLYPVSSGTGRHVNQTRSGGVVGVEETHVHYVKAAGITKCYVYVMQGNGVVYFDLAAVSVLSNPASATGFVSSSIEDIGSGWRKLTVTSKLTSGNLRYCFTGPCDADGSTSVTANGTDGLYIWGFHAYRSDLGGMVNNPDRGDSYVPTTSSAVYLPRRGHHVYNGSAWVNEGVLHESEARTNLVTYSQDFTDASWAYDVNATNVTRTPNSADGPDGITNSATKLTLNAGKVANAAYIASGPFAYSNPYTISAYMKSGEYNYGVMSTGQYASGFHAIFDLLNGVVATAPADPETSAKIEDCGNGWFRCSITTVDDAGTEVCLLTCSPANNLTTNGVGGEGIYVYGAQFEVGQAPSSYMPTSGSSSTRAAETLTIPAANLPWPSPVVIGPELVTNGTFDTDTDWTKGTGWTISGGEASHVAGAATLLYQTMSLTLGKVYQATCDVVAVSGGTGSLQFRNGGTTTGVIITDSDIGKTVSVIYAAEGNNQIAVFAGSGTNLTIDNISVKEINPLAVSIQMQGQMTYADNGVGVAVDGQTAEVAFASWRIDSSNYIAAGLSTGGAQTGQPVFLQEVAGVFDFVNPTGSPYSPGINVPFNIASRHGSTFINGAVDGTALTADTTPTALPDLSATDLNLGYDYMGTIKQFRIWANDIGDTGIAEATLPSLEPSLSLTFDGSENSFTVSDWSE